MKTELERDLDANWKVSDDEAFRASTKAVEAAIAESKSPRSLLTKLNEAELKDRRKKQDLILMFRTLNLMITRRTGILSAM